MDIFGDRPIFCTQYVQKHLVYIILGCRYLSAADRYQTTSETHQNQCKWKGKRLLVTTNQVWDFFLAKFQKLEGWIFIGRYWPTNHSCFALVLIHLSRYLPSTAPWRANLHNFFFPGGSVWPVRLPTLHKEKQFPSRLVHEHEMFDSAIPPLLWHPIINNFILNKGINGIHAALRLLGSMRLKGVFSSSLLFLHRVTIVMTSLTETTPAWYVFTSISFPADGVWCCGCYYTGLPHVPMLLCNRITCRHWP